MIELTIEVPDNVAQFLRTQGNVSACITRLVRRQMLDPRRQLQRVSSQSYVQHLRERTTEQIEADEAMDEHDAEISLRGAEW